MTAVNDCRTLRDVNGMWNHAASGMLRPTLVVLLAPPPRMTVPRGGGDDLYGREDFKTLKRFGDVPVRPLETSGSPEPFITDTEKAR